ncbi:MAG: VWA domain-containing protein [Phycisphaerales bacterium]
MTLLAPSAAIVGAAVACSALLLLYILKLLRSPLRVSNIRFWPVADEDTQVNAPFRAIRPSWLFLLHLLVLALAVLAIGRPTIVLDTPGGDRVFLLLDVSASMGAVDPGESETRLERAKRRGMSLASTILRSGRQSVCVIPFAASAQAVTAFTTSNGAVRAAIADAAQTDQPGDLGAALAVAGALVGDSERSGATSIILLSDGAFARPESVSQRTLTAPCPLAFERIGPEAAGPLNAGIVAISARRDPADPVMVRVFAEVSATPEYPRNLPFTLALDGNPLLSRTVAVPPAELGGRVALPLTVRAPEGGVLTITLGTPDALTADDTASLVLPRPPSPRIVLVQPRGPAVAGAAPADWLLGDVLEELRPASLRRMMPADFAANPPGPDAADLIVLDRVAVEKLPAIPSLSFGGVLGLPGLASERLDQPLVTPAVVWDREHPSLNGLSLDALLVEQRTELRPGADSQWKWIVKGTRGPLVVSGEIDGVRRVVCGFELSLSNWPLMPEFPIFVASAVDYLTHRESASVGAGFTTARPVRLRASGPGEVVLTGPGTLRAKSTGNEEVSFGLASRVGLYAASGADARFAAVNLVDETESLLASPLELSVGDAVVRAAAPGKAQKELWPQLLAALAALLMVEWVVFGFKARV